MAKTPYPSEVLDRYIIRFPAGMRERIAESAKRNKRSMNAEILLALDDYYRRQEHADAIVDEAAQQDSGSVVLFTEGTGHDLLEKLKTALDENLKTRQLMNQQLKLLRDLSAQKLDYSVILDPDSTPVPAKRTRKPAKD